MRRKCDSLPRKVTLLACSALLTLAGSCTEPAAPVKLLVTNSTCASGACTTIRVLAFPDNQPVTPGGLWSLDLGSVSGASDCLTIPASAKFRITDAGTGETTTLTWTTAKKVSIGWLRPGQSTIQASPSTGAFVPATGPSWSVELPGSATPTPIASCQ